MKRSNDMKTTLKLSLRGERPGAGRGPAASAEVYDLCAAAGTKTMPDGSTVPVWGYALNDPTERLRGDPDTRSATRQSLTAR